MNNQDKITMAALKLAKAHTRWKTGKGSVKSFGRAKGVFIAEVQDELLAIHQLGQQDGWSQAFKEIEKVYPVVGLGL